MNNAPAELPPLAFWSTVCLLLGASRKRAVGRQKRQQQLLNHRARKKVAINWGSLGFIIAILFTTVLHFISAFVVYEAVMGAERLQAARDGRLVVSSGFYGAVKKAHPFGFPSRFGDEQLNAWYYSEARETARTYGGDPAEIEKKLRKAVSADGLDDLIPEYRAAPGIKALYRAGTFPAMMGSIILIWWFVMVVSQGEGLELDLQRRRHPMWEWLFSHPVQPGPVFLAEMLSPIAANPIYIGAPAFTGLLYGFIYGAVPGILAAILIGIPLTIAAACLGKAIEIGLILRFSSRSRGAMLGLISWLGYASMMLMFISVASIRHIIAVIGPWLEPLTILPWPWLQLFLGTNNHGSFSFLSGLLFSWSFCVIVIAAATAFAIWGARRGLSGNFGLTDSAPVRASGKIRFGREPLYRKEYLWFIRDRSALVQTILIPITVAGFQVFNLRGVIGEAQSAWNYLCGVAILLGTYFLWILGPKSLASEGGALWIALTWPRGMESLLKAKAWLWTLISTGIVSLVLIYAAVMFPANIWEIALVGIGWFFFGKSMAEKSVTLVTVPSSSGEPEKIPAGRRWAASLGMLTFALGILTQQWPLAVSGIVYSTMTATAMWENFRARLPYLFDAWSEKLPTPPTLMHAMIAISILIESVAIFTGIGLAAWGRDNLAIVQPTTYAICAIIIAVILTHFLYNKGVPLHDILTWPTAVPPAEKKRPWWCGDGNNKGAFSAALFTGAVAGLLLGLLAHAYLALLLHFPTTADLILKSQVQMAKFPGLHTSYVIIAVFLAPFAEEYLFRGLLFRALDRQWGGWRAILGSALFFAVYHPFLSWLPVGLLGVCNALIFKKTGKLAPAVALHMVYNAVVLG